MSGMQGFAAERCIRDYSLDRRRTAERDDWVPPIVKPAGHVMAPYTLLSRLSPVAPKFASAALALRVGTAIAVAVVMTSVQ